MRLPDARQGSWEDVLHLEAWNWLVDPLAPRRIGMTARQVDQFARCVSAGETPDISGEDGLKAIEMCEAALLSGRTDEAIRVPISPEVRQRLTGGRPLFGPRSGASAAAG